MILLLILLLLNIFDIQVQRSAEGISQEELSKLDSTYSNLILYFIVNNLFNIVFALFTYVGTYKKPITYVYSIFWFIVWLMFTIGAFFVYEGNLSVKIINSFIGISCTVIMLILFFDLSQKRRQLDFERNKKRYQL